MISATRGPGLRRSSRLMGVMPVVVAILATSLLSGCAKSNESAVTPTTNGPTGSLRSADEVERERTKAAEEKARAATPLATGETGKLGSLSVTVKSVVRSSKNPGPDDRSLFGLDVQVRVENPGSADAITPNFIVVCNDGLKGNIYFPRDSEDAGAYQSSKKLPGGSFKEGLALLDFPVGCTGPLLRANFGGSDSESVDWVLPPDVIGSAIGSGSAGSPVVPAPTNPTPTTAPSTTASSASGASDNAALEAANAAFVSTVAANDVAAGYKLLSANCRSQFSQDQYGAYVAKYGSIVKGLHVVRVEVRSATGTTAEARYFLGKADNQPIPGVDPIWQKWVYEGGSWLLDTCKFTT